MISLRPQIFHTRMPNISAYYLVWIFNVILLTIGLLAACSFGNEVLLVRELTSRKLDGFNNGLYFIFVVGLCGLSGLVWLSSNGKLSEEVFTEKDYLILLLGGLSESLGMLSCLYACSIGVGGIAFGLANSCCVFVTLFNYFVMQQPITKA